MPPLSFSNKILAPAIAGFTRIDTHFCEATPRINTGVADSGLIGWDEWDITAAFPSIPSTLSFVELSVAIPPVSLGVAGTLTGATIQSGNGINAYMSSGIKYYEFGVTAVGTQIGDSSTILRYPVHGLPNIVKVWRNLIVFGGGQGGLGVINLTGYWD